MGMPENFDHIKYEFKPDRDKEGSEKRFDVLENTLSTQETKAVSGQKGENQPDQITDLKSQIEDINEQVQEGKLGLAEAENLVAELEEQIYQAEEKNRNDEVMPKINQAKEEIEAINYEAGHGQKKIEVADSEVKDLEEKIYDLEKSIKPNREPDELDTAEVVDPVVPENTSNPENQETKQEYLRLKKEFKQSKAELKQAIEAELENKGSLFKKFGFGRDKMSPKVQEHYDAFMATNHRYHNYADQNGFFDKINERLHRNTNAKRKEIREALESTDVTVDELASIKDQEDLNQLAETKNVSVDMLIDCWQKIPAAHKEYDIRPAVADRHIIKPAEERLNAQSFSMPPMLAKLKNSIMVKASKHPNVAKVAAVGFGAGMAIANPFAMAAGFATRYAGNKLFINKAEAKVQTLNQSARENFFTAAAGEVDLEKLEQEYFKSISDVDKYKVRTNTVAVGAAFGGGMSANAIGIETLPEQFVSAGAPDNLPTGETSTPVETVSGDNDPGVSSANPENVVPEPTEPVEADPESISENQEVISEDTETGSVDETLEDSAEASEPAPVAAEQSSAAEKIINFESHEVKRGDSLSEILRSNLQKAIDSGEYSLPERATEEGGLSSYIYEKFPEFTTANDKPALSLDNWRAIGVDSGNPNRIYPGETININALVEIMNGGHPDQVLENLVTEAGEISTSQPSGQDVPTMYDYGQGPIEGYTTLGDAEAAAAAEASQADGHFIDPYPTDPNAPFAVPTTLDPADYASPEPAETGGPAVDSQASPEADSVPIEKMFTISDYYSELKSEFVEPEPVGQHLYNTLIMGVQEGNIILPLDMTINGVDYANDLEAYLVNRLPELGTDSGLFRPVEVGELSPPALTEAEWAKLGVPGGDVTEMMQSGSTLETGRLLNFILSGDKSVLFPKP